MVSWWDGDAVLGTTAFDIQDGNDGTLLYGATITPGKVGDAFRFDGSGAFVEVPDSPALNNNGAGFSEFTLDFWFRRSQAESIGDADYIISKDAVGFNTGDASVIWDHDSVSNGNVIFLDNGQSPAKIIGFPVSDVTLDEWHHLAVVANSGTASMYLDGVLKNSDSGFNTDIWGNSFNLEIGSIVAGTPSVSFFGDIDEVEIFDRALSEQEILGIFIAGSAGKCKAEDSDGDGVPDEEDNCPTVFNPGQEQTGNNVGGPFGDACVAPDSDIGDGVDLGDGATVGNGSQIGDGSSVGDNTSIGDGVVVKPDVMIGADSSIWRRH